MVAGLDGHSPFLWKKTSVQFNIGKNNDFSSISFLVSRQSKCRVVDKPKNEEKYLKYKVLCYNVMQRMLWIEDS